MISRPECLVMGLVQEPQSTALAQADEQADRSSLVCQPKRVVHVSYPVAALSLRESVVFRFSEDNQLLVAGRPGPLES